VAQTSKVHRSRISQEYRNPSGSDHTCHLYANEKHMRSKNSNLTSQAFLVKAGFVIGLLFIISPSSDPQSSLVLPSA
jgi:hypothetical protein